MTKKMPEVGAIPDAAPSLPPSSVNPLIVETRARAAKAVEKSPELHLEQIKSAIIKRKEIVDQMKILEEHQRTRTDVQQGFRDWALRAGRKYADKNRDLNKNIKTFEDDNQKRREDTFGSSSATLENLAKQLEDLQGEITEILRKMGEREEDQSPEKHAIAQSIVDVIAARWGVPLKQEDVFLAIFGVDPEAAEKALKNLTRDMKPLDKATQKYWIDEIGNFRTTADKIVHEKETGWMTEAALIGKATHPDKIDNILYGKPWLTDLCAKHKEKTIELTTDTGANFLLYIDKGGMFKVLTSSVPRAYGPSRNPSVVLEGEQNKSNVELPTSRPMYIHAYSENRVKQALDGLSVGNELSCKVVSKKSQKLIPAKIKKDKGGRLVVTDAREPAVLAISGGGMSHVPGKEWFDMPNGEQINANPGRWIHPQTLRLLPNEKTIGKAPAALVKARV